MRVIFGGRNSPGLQGVNAKGIENQPTLDTYSLKIFFNVVPSPTRVAQSLPVVENTTAAPTVGETID
jgi:hypothetical protein